jgi:hypothetical protein
LNAIKNIAPKHIAEPYVDPMNLTQAIKIGILDAPHLKNNPFGRGLTATMIDDKGECIAIEPTTGKPLREKERIERLFNDREYSIEEK